MRANLYQAAAIPTITDLASGLELELPGYIQVGTTSDGSLLLLATPGAPALEGMTVLRSGLRRPWTYESYLAESQIPIGSGHTGAGLPTTGAGEGTVDPGTTPTFGLDPDPPMFMGDDDDPGPV